VHVQITLALGAAPRERIALENGEILPAQKTFELDWKKQSQEVRAALLEIAGDLEALVNLDLSSLPFPSSRVPYAVDAYPESASDWKVLLRAYLLRRGARRCRKEHELEKHAWVERHGSAYLRQMLQHSYPAEARYALERGALEHPGFVIVPQLETATVDTPSKRALDCALEHSGRVVWLSHPPPLETLFPAPCEAVLIEPYLDDWRLLRQMPYEFARINPPMLEVAND
jgi:hypothetical protein